MSQTGKTCNKCNKYFKTNTTFNKHVNNQLACDQVLQCLFCEKVYVTAVAFFKHTHNGNIFCKTSLSRQLTRAELHEYEISMVDERKEYKEMVKQKMIDELLAKVPPRGPVPESMAAAFAAQELRGVKKQITAQILKDRVSLEKRIELGKLFYKLYVKKYTETNNETN